MMELRPYQLEFIEAVERGFADGHKRLMAVAATGAGKTIMAAELMRREPGNCLFLADAKELVDQNAAKFQSHTGERCGVEMGPQQARVGVDRVVVATSQSLCRRLDRYEPDHFNLIITDECHRALGESHMAIFDHFSYARVLGVTATPFRSDRKQLGDFYEKIAIEIGLDRLIREGHLARIQIKSIPMSVDLRSVRMSGGDYSTTDLGEVIEPILKEAAQQLIAHAADRRKIVVFLPLVKTSIRMARILAELGVKAVHVSGDERDEMDAFVKGDARVICNAQLLTTGWDCPEVDCIFILRPTKSLALFSQMCGRGTRNHPGKENLLVLDPLFLTDDHKLINPARLVARTEEEAKAMMERIAKDGGGDLLYVEKDAEEARIAALEARINTKRKKKARFVDAIEFALACGDNETASYEPEFGWETAKPSEKQIAALEKAGFDIDEIRTRGQASRLLDLLFVRRKQGLASPKQLRLLKRLGHESPNTLTFEAASAWIDARLAGGNPMSKPAIPIQLKIKLRAAGLNPSSYPSEDAAEAALEKIGAVA